jgi:chromate transporter
VIGVVAGIALIRFKVGVIPVVLVAGAVGIAATFARPLFA